MIKFGMHIVKSVFSLNSTEIFTNMLTYIKTSTYNIMINMQTKCVQDRYVGFNQWFHKKEV